MSEEAVYRDSDWLRDKYHNKGMTIREIANEINSSTATIHKWMDKLDIERRTKGEHARTIKPSFGMTAAGYEYAHGRDNNSLVYIHRLAAVAWYGFDNVVEKDVHHETNIPWDNREDNIKPLSQKEHRKLHGDKRYNSLKWRNKEKLEAMYENYTMEDIANEWNCSKSTIYRWVNKHGIKTRNRSEY